MAKKTVAPAPSAPIITVDHVRALRDQGRLARVEVYPIPEAQSPDSPSVIVRTLPPGVEGSYPAPPPAPAARASRSRFIIDGVAEHVLRGGPGVVGRAPDAVAGSQIITLHDPGRSLSRNHLAFETDVRGRVFVADLESANGTEIVRAAGDRVECVPGRRYEITSGDTVLIGDFTIAFRVE